MGLKISPRADDEHRVDVGYSVPLVDSFYPSSNKFNFPRLLILFFPRK